MGNMIETSLALQKAVRAALTSSPYVTDICPADRIFDGRARPEKFPCVIIGEAVTAREDLTLGRQHVRAVLDLHVWTTEPGLAVAKTIAGAVVAVLDHGIGPVEGHHVADFRVATSRFMRDPAAEHGHGVLTVEALLEILS
jgi:hypothetical protein